MPSLRAQRLGFAFDTHSLFDELSFTLGPGWTGLVGANGAGKTTLLRLIRGELTPTHGALVREPRGARVAWCPQRVEEKDAELDAFAWAHDGLARKLHGRLRLEPEALERWATLSPGERKRWQLGAALWTEPDVLLLDEPGNHLDVEALGWLRGVLREFRGVGVLVSHDRALLDDVTSATLRLVDGGGRLFAHPFTAARELWRSEEAQAREAQRETRRRLEKEERKLDARRRTLTAATKQRSVGARMKDKHDADARTLAADYRAENAERAHAATLRRVERQAEGLRADLASVRVRDEAGQRLFVRYEPCPKSTVVQFRGDVRAGERVLLRDFTLQLRRDERLWLRGPNGAGKTSLLEAVLREGCLVPGAREVRVRGDDGSLRDARGDGQTDQHAAPAGSRDVPADDAVTDSLRAAHGAPGSRDVRADDAVTDSPRAAHGDTPAGRDAPPTDVITDPLRAQGDAPAGSRRDALPDDVVTDALRAARDAPGSRDVPADDAVTGSLRAHGAPGRDALPTDGVTDPLRPAHGDTDSLRAAQGDAPIRDALPTDAVTDSRAAHGGAPGGSRRDGLPDDVVTDSRTARAGALRGRPQHTARRTELGNEADLASARIVVLPQDLPVAETRADLAAVRALPPEERGRVLQLVHALGVEPEQLLRSAAPSPGEARKLRLALGLGRHAWLLVLDEPTNHLDLPAIERLEAALLDFPGAVLLVTHDERLGERVATRQCTLLSA